MNKNIIGIKYSKDNNWLGQTGQNSLGYVTFNSGFDGLRAAIVVIKDYFYKHSLNTISGIITKHSQVYESNILVGYTIQEYIDFVSSQTGFSPDKELSLKEILYSVLPAMALFETTTFIEEDEITYNLTHAYIR